MVKQSENEKKVSVRNQFFIAILANIPNMCFGTFLGWLSPAVPQLQSEFGPSTAPLTDIQISWLGAALTFGAIPGTVLYTWLVDRFGRKASLFCLSIPFAIGWAMIICSSEFYVLLIARFIAGLPSGGNYIIIPLYIKEISDSSCRGILGTILTLAANVGIIAGYALGGYSDYHINLWICLALPLLHMVVFFFMGLESPDFLVKQGRFEEAATAIAWLRRVDPSDKIVLHDIDDINAEHLEAATTPPVSFMSLIKNPVTLEPLKLCLGIIMLHSLSGAFAVLTYASVVFQRAGDGWDPNAQALLTGCIQLVGCSVTFVIVDKVGRKIILTSACVSSFLSLAILTVWFYLLDMDVVLPGWVPLLGVCLCIFSYGFGISPLPYVIISEVFDFKTRATLSAYILICCWFNNSWLLLGFKPLSNLLGMGAIFLLFSLINVFGIIFMLLFLPETKGKSVDEIQTELLMRKKRGRLSCYRK